MSESSYWRDGVARAMTRDNVLAVAVVLTWLACIVMGSTSGEDAAWWEGVKILSTPAGWFTARAAGKGAAPSA